MNQQFYVLWRTGACLDQGCPELVGIFLTEEVAEEARVHLNSLRHKQTGDYLFYEDELVVEAITGNQVDHWLLEHAKEDV